MKRKCVNSTVDAVKDCCECVLNLLIPLVHKESKIKKDLLNTRDAGASRRQVIQEFEGEIP